MFSYVKIDAVHCSCLLSLHVVACRWRRLLSLNITVNVDSLQETGAGAKYFLCPHFNENSLFISQQSVILSFIPLYIFFFIISYQFFLPS